MKQILVYILIIPNLLFSQTYTDWYHLDPVEDSVLGISSQKAYEFLKDKPSETVIVAVIDNGAEITHKDLADNIWINKDEIPDNGIDDDKNGYIDDIHGWNFLGNSEGENMKNETLVVTRYFKLLNDRFAGKTKKEIARKDKEDYKFYLLIKQRYEKELSEQEKMKNTYELLLENYNEAKEILSNYFESSDYSLKNVENIETEDKELLWAIKIYTWANSNYYTKGNLEKSLKDVNTKLESRLNPDYNIRKEIVGDDPTDINDSIYGNNNVAAKGPYHGTSVAGVIGAMNNDFGIDGIAKNVKLMILRVVPNGDERDKDVALAIKYAVRNGADIINCSFAKDFMMHPEFIYNAMKEAENKDVLIIHAAGNESRNIDKEPAYPNGFYDKRTKAKNWMNIGATNSADTETLISYFSNYGKKSVDVFAPGSRIRTTVLNNQYEYTSGTSIASPIVAGVAAVIKSYYPHLTSLQIRQIIIESAYIPTTKKVYVPTAGAMKRKMKRVSVAGGIVNLYNAVQLAESYNN